MEQIHDFFAEIHAEMRKYGVIEEMHVLDNQSDHLIGNVYVRYQKRKMAESMVTANRGRWYAGRCMLPHLVPVPNRSSRPLNTQLLLEIPTRIQRKTSPTPEKKRKKHANPSLLSP